MKLAFQTVESIDHNYEMYITTESSVVNGASEPKRKPYIHCRPL